MGKKAPTLYEVLAGSREPGSDDEPQAKPEHEQDDSGFIWLDDFCKQPPLSTWLIRGYLEMDCTAVMFGDSQAGKSFVAIDQCCHIAHGLKWRNKKVKQGVVLYIAGEGQNGLRRRFKAWHEYHNLPIRKNIAIRTVPVRLCEPSAVNSLMEYINKLLNDVKPVLIVIDTLNKNFGSGDESKTSDMSNFVAGIEQLRNRTGACVMTVHHVGHGDKTRGRGSIALYDGIDFEYRIEREGEPEDVNSLVTRMVPTKTKDGSYPDSLCWKWNLQSLPWLELDDDDNPVPLSSIVLTPTDYVDPKATSSPSKALGTRQRKALDELKRLIKEHEENLTASGLDASNAKVAVEDWVNVVKRIEPDRSNRSRLIETLKTKGLICISDGYVNVVMW